MPPWSFVCETWEIRDHRAANTIATLSPHRSPH